MESLGISPAFWRGKRVLVTGHTGFKGSWLTLWLRRLDAEVIGYSLAPPSEPNLFTLANVGAAARPINGDVRRLEDLHATMRSYHPQIVIHMAAQSLVRRSYVDPVATYATNVMGTLNVLEAARSAESVRAIVVVTSDKCYENRERHPGYRETDALGGADPYSNSKGCAELLTTAYRQSFFSDHHVAIASVRAGNVVGGGDWALDRLVPDVLNAFMHNTPASIRNPEAVRPWQHVLDPLWGYLRLAELLWHEKGAYAEAWNFGPAEEDVKPVSWIADNLVRLWGDSAGWAVERSPQPHEAQSLRLDSSKARLRLNWSSRLSVGAALEWTVEWYKAYQRGADMREGTLAQIERFQENLVS